jgi:hypothetical protein
LGDGECITGNILERESMRIYTTLELDGATKVKVWSKSETNIGALSISKEEADSIFSEIKNNDNFRKARIRKQKITFEYQENAYYIDVPSGELKKFLGWYGKTFNLCLVVVDNKFWLSDIRHEIPGRF